MQFVYLLLRYSFFESYQQLPGFIKRSSLAVVHLFRDLLARMRIFVFGILE